MSRALKTGFGWCFGAFLEYISLCLSEIWSGLGKLPVSTCSVFQVSLDETFHNTLGGCGHLQVEAEAAEKERAKEEEQRRLRELEAEYSATVQRLEHRVQEADQQSQLKACFSLSALLHHSHNRKQPPGPGYWTWKPHMWTKCLGTASTWKYCMCFLGPFITWICVSFPANAAAYAGVGCYHCTRMCH